MRRAFHLELHITTIIAARCKNVWRRQRRWDTDAAEFSVRQVNLDRQRDAKLERGLVPNEHVAGCVDSPRVVNLISHQKKKKCQNGREERKPARDIGPKHPEDKTAGDGTQETDE